eukprot:4660928-Amphidinium_carterae.1
MSVLFFIILNVIFIALGSSDNMARVVRLYRRTPDNVVPNREDLEPPWGRLCSTNNNNYMTYK